MPTDRKKVARFTVDGEEMSITFIPVYDKEDDPEQVFCNTCPLLSFCELLPDPRDITDKEHTMMDFCLATGDQSPSEVLSSDKYENLMPDVSDVIKFSKKVGTPVYQKLIEKNPYVELTAVIDQVCGPEGFTCPMYTKSHEYCSVENKMCVLHRLFPTLK
jgi:hypothetical protein